jgi:hypothetical protein
MAPNDFVIRPLKNASGEFTGGMNFDPNLISFGETKMGKNNMKFTNVSYDGRRILVETPEMDIPAGVVQYPKPEDVNPGDRVSYTLLMSFDRIDERPDLRAYKDFLDTIQDKVLDMTHARSSDLFGKTKSREVLADIQSVMVRESDKYAPSSAIGLPYATDTDASGVETMKPLYVTYDFDMILNGGLRPDGSPKPEAVIPSIHDIDTKRGSVKVIYPLSSVWSSLKGFGISMKAKEVLVRSGATSNAFAFDVGATKKDDVLLEPSDDEGDDEVANVGKEVDNLGLDDDE